MSLMKQVLMLHHVPYEGQGYIADYPRDHGLRFDVLRLWERYAVPDVSECSALIVMGGPMGTPMIITVRRIMKGGSVYKKTL
jgi:hypothetical protein